MNFFKFKLTWQNSTVDLQDFWQFMRVSDLFSKVTIQANYGSTGQYL